MSWACCIAQRQVALKVSVRLHLVHPISNELDALIFFKNWEDWSCKMSDQNQLSLFPGVYRVINPLEVQVVLFLLSSLGFGIFGWLALRRKTKKKFWWIYRKTAMLKWIREVVALQVEKKTLQAKSCKAGLWRRRDFLWQLLGFCRKVNVFELAAPRSLT